MGKGKNPESLPCLRLKKNDFINVNNKFYFIFKLTPQQRTRKIDGIRLRNFFNFNFNFKKYCNIL